MRRLLIVCVVVAVGCFAWSEPVPEEDSTNSVPAEVVSTNDVSAEVSSTNVVSEAATNAPALPIEDVFPVEVEGYVAAKPVSAGLDSLFENLDSIEEGATNLSREVLVESLREGQGRAGVGALLQYLRRRAEGLTSDDSVKLEEMFSITCCARSLEAFQDSDISSNMWAWLFNSDERIRLVAETVTDDDNPVEAARIIQTLYEHDPESRDRFLNLILALAVVWDTPRKIMDDQLEPGWLQPDEDITLYYDYFKKLYSSSKAKVAYDELNVDSLVFVVHIPTPVSELEWALENVDGSRSHWGKHYQDIQYDHTRIFREQYDWPHKEYTLQEIQECFGICVDQAYYSVITARAHGIPCLYFHGVGKSAGHAWFGFMKKETEWDLEVGRYSKQGYATGFAVHPQTDRQMTDHELDYYCARSLQPKKFRDASVLVHLADLLQGEDFSQGALVAAQKAREIDPMCDEAWEIECELLVNMDRIDEAIELLKEKAVCFKYFKDVSAAALTRQAELLERSGDAEAAEKLLRREVAKIASRRDDLQQDLVLAQANQLLSQGRGREGMEVIERIIREQLDDGRGLKVRSLIDEYKKYAERAGMSSKADYYLRDCYR